MCETISCTVFYAANLHYSRDNKSRVCKNKFLFSSNCTLFFFKYTVTFFAIAF